MRLPVSVRFHTAAIAWPRETVAVFSWSFRLKSRCEITLLSCPVRYGSLCRLGHPDDDIISLQRLIYKVVRLAQGDNTVAGFS